MALAASGQIDFGQIQTEFGGSNPISMNEYGDKIGLTVGTTSAHDMADFYGLSNTWTATMTIGSQSAKPGTRYGYIAPSSIGSLSDTTVDTLGGATISELRTNFSPAGIYIVWSSTLNTGWTSITIGSNTINRTSFSTAGTTHSLASGSYINTSGTQTIAFNI